MAAHTQQRHTHQRKGVGGCWEREPLHKERLPPAPLSPLSLCWSPAAITSALAILTEEGSAIETDGGLAGHLGSIEDCIIELVREGEGLWTCVGSSGSSWRGLQLKHPLDIFLPPSKQG